MRSDTNERLQPTRIERKLRQAPSDGAFCTSLDRLTSVNN